MYVFKPLITLVAVGALGCTTSSRQAPEVDRQAVEAEVTTWLQTFWTTWAEGGAGFDRGIAMYDDHPDFSLASDGQLWSSLASADAAFRPFFQTIDHQTFDIPEAAIAVLGQDLVHVSLQGAFTQWNVDGTHTGPTRFAATMTLVRTDGAWKVRFYHQSQPNASTTDAGGGA